ncbi:hypothetical protein GQ43DRAFT_440295 [Delitschia confertaspora ATCC 74209]|uniref:Uncharacterized protein n=1 Tax=Delitschia confertaspora ATCC 74209 TaxID=1513339 RepID=A0A9P4JLM6_9PLEO|nr:hypothetical protein GQ43DRAFT_440295 [Delitschia confertaspora ATCC 74209]
MSDLSPTAPSQPTQSQAYSTPGNPVSKTPSEAAEASANAHSNAPIVDQRIPQTQQPSSTSNPQRANGEWGLGRGIRGAGAGEEKEGKTEEDVGRHNELDGAQMAMPGEGRVADAVSGRDGVRGGIGGAEQDFVSDLDRKKAEQAPAREAIKEKRQHDVDVGGALGQRGGPVNPESAK